MVDANCEIKLSMPVVTISKCSTIAAQMSQCAHAKISNDLVAGLISHPDAELKYQAIEYITREWMQGCKRYVAN